MTLATVALDSSLAGSSLVLTVPSALPGTMGNGLPVSVTHGSGPATATGDLTAFSLHIGDPIDVVGVVGVINSAGTGWSATVAGFNTNPWSNDDADEFRSTSGGIDDGGGGGGGDSVGDSAITLDDVILVATGTVLISATLTRTLGPVASAPVLTASGVWATATHRVRVVLTTEPRHADMFDPGDATNPRTWAVTRLDTGEPVPVIAAVMAADDPANLTVDLTLLEPLATHLVSHELAIAGLLTLAGAPMTGPTVFDFLGLVQTMDPIELATIDVFRDRDLANPPFQIDRGIGYSGTIVIGADGDYDTDAGQPLLRKLVMRRMGTRRGTIRHLPNYGLGLIEKEPIGASGDVVRLRTEIEDQTMQEPDVISAQARLSMSRSGVLVVQLFVRAKSGLSLNIRMGAAGGRLVEL